MKQVSFFDLLKKISYVLTAVMAGIFLFISLTAFSINRTVLDSSFHKHLFEKNNIYNQVYSVISNSLSDFESNLTSSLPGDPGQNMKILNMVKKSITAQMVATNLDSVREGIFQYFKGERMFLPDIYFNIKPDAGSMSGTASGALKFAAEAFTKIDKINLSAILLYLNRSDISEQLFVLKFIYYVMRIIPGFSLLLVVFLFIAGLILSRKTTDVTKWSAVFFLSYGLPGIIAGIGMYVYIHAVMAESIYPLAASLPLKSTVILSYLRDCLTPTALFVLVSGIVLALAAIGMFKLSAVLPAAFSGEPQNHVLSANTQKAHRIVRISVYVFLCLMIAFSMFLKLQAFKKDFEVNNFASAVARMKNANKVTQVISARDEAIYTVNIKLIDSKSEEPVKDTRIDISGKSTISDKNFDESSITDETGTARYNLGEGNFRVSFVSSQFPSDYQLPTPFFFDLKTPGTTIITIRLDAIPEDMTRKWGIIEIEVLDINNNPVPGMELTISGMISAPGNPNSLFSYTNSEGIAVFKVNEGIYSAAFVEPNFPSQYIMPLPIEVTASPDSVTRYTIRMVEDKQKEQKNVNGE